MLKMNRKKIAYGSSGADATDGRFERTSSKIEAEKEKNYLSICIGYKEYFTKHATKNR